MLPIGDDTFATCVANSMLIDNSMLIADVLDSGFKATLFCRPHRFGKSLNLNMTQRFFETPSKSDPAAMDKAPLFEGLSIWDAEGGRYCERFAVYSAISLSMKTLKFSNRETEQGRYDIHLVPLEGSGNPLITFELKCAAKGSQVDGAQLACLACDALAQIEDRAYNADVLAAALRYGIAFAGKRVSAVIGRL